MSSAPSDDLPCVQVVVLITEYLDGALPTEQANRLEAHLTECGGCAVVLEQFRTTIHATGGLVENDVDALDPGTRDELLGVFRRWAAERGG